MRNLNILCSWFLFCFDVSLSENLHQKYILICPASASPKAIVWRLVKHFSVGQSNTSDQKGQIEHRIKCNEKSVARVKALVDEDAHTTVQEMAETVHIIFIGKDCFGA